jgi:hypothetical protein
VNVNVEKNVPVSIAQVASEAPTQEETRLHYTSNSYQKILDYHVSEILLTTIIIGTILLLRLHH